MKKLFSILILMSAFATGANAQLLYKVSGNGLDKDSYIVGIHKLINPQGIVQRISGVKEAMIATDQMYFESAPDSASYIKEMRILAGGRTLKEVLTPGQYAKLNAFLKKYEGVGLESPQVQKRYGNLTPLAMKDELEKLLFVANHMGEYDPTHTFNEYFEAQAKVNKEPMFGLNSISGQVAHLKNLPLQRQTEILMDFIEHEDAQLGIMDRMAAAFERQDADAVSKVSPMTPETAQTVSQWSARMPEIMKTPTLFVVGADKLGGEKGLLNLLKKGGYTVEGVR